MQDVDPEDESHGAFEHYSSVPEPVGLTITEIDVATVAARLSGAAGPSGTDSVDLRNWLLCFGTASERLRQELARFTKWLANSSPSWAAYRALMAA